MPSEASQISLECLSIGFGVGSPHSISYSAGFVVVSGNSVDHTAIMFPLLSVHLRKGVLEQLWIFGLHPGPNQHIVLFIDSEFVFRQVFNALQESTHTMILFLCIYSHPLPQQGLFFTPSMLGKILLLPFAFFFSIVDILMAVVSLPVWIIRGCNVL